MDGISERKEGGVLFQLRILVGDDHALLVNGVRQLLEEKHKVIGTASNGRDLLQRALQWKPDLIVLDVSMPEMNGIEAARAIHALLPSVKLVFLSMHSNLLYVRQAFAAGGTAYVLKTGIAEELSDAVEVAWKGGTYISPGLGIENMPSLNTSRVLAKESEDGLTPRQREILQLIADGKLSKEIAYALDLSVKTVDYHRAKIMAKFGTHSSIEMVRIAVEQGIVTPRADSAG